MDVYYAVSYANNSLAIIYYADSQELQKDQLDFMMCEESKFALMKGELLPGDPAAS